MNFKILLIIIFIFNEYCAHSLKRSYEIAIENFEKANESLRKRQYKEAYEINLSIYNNPDMNPFKERATLNLAIIHLSQDSPYYDFEKAKGKFKEIMEESLNPFFINLVRIWLKYMQNYEDVLKKNSFLNIEVEGKEQTIIKMNEEIGILKKKIEEVNEDLKRKEKNEKKLKTKLDEYKENLELVEKEKKELMEKVKSLQETLNKVKEVDTHE